MKAGSYLLLTVLAARIFALQGQETTFIKIVDGDTVVPFTQGVQLVDFQAPALSRGTVAFCASNQERLYQGVFHSTARSFTKLADTQTEVPGGDGGTFGSFDYFEHYNCPSYSSLRAAFLATISPGVRGIYLGFAGPIPLKVAAPGDRLPTDDANFTPFFGPPSIDFDPESQSGQVVFKGHADFVPAQPAILSYGIGGNSVNRVVARRFDPFPDRPGESFDDFSQPTSDSGRIAFRGEGAAGSLGIFLYSPETGLTAIATDNTPIPDGEGTFSSFGSIIVKRAIVATSEGNAVFRGGGSDGQQGIYAWIDGTLVKIVDRNTPLPDGSGNFTGFFDQVPSIDGDKVAFFGIAGFRTGIFVWMSGVLRQVVEVGGQIDGKRLNGVDIGPQALDGSFLAFRARFEGGTQAIYLAALQLVATDVLADLTNDGIVDFRDVALVQRSFGTCPQAGDCPSDQNGDGVVDNLDVLEVYARRGFVGVDHDHAYNALDIGGGQSVSVDFTTEGATTSTHPLPPTSGGDFARFVELNCNEGSGLEFHNDVWFRYQIPSACPTFVATTCGTTNFDTRLGVYAPLDSSDLLLETISCNDDTPGCSGGSMAYFHGFTLRSNPSIGLEARPLNEVLIRLGSREPNLTGSGTLLVGCAVDAEPETGFSPQNPLPMFAIRQPSGALVNDGRSFRDWPTTAQDVTPDCGDGDTIGQWWSFASPCSGVISARGRLSHNGFPQSNLLSLAVFDSLGQDMRQCNSVPIPASAEDMTRVDEVPLVWSAVSGNLYQLRIGAGNGVQNLAVSDSRIFIECTGDNSCGLASTGPCNEARAGTPGCSDGSCCQTVCQEDPYCCNIEWDESCVSRAARLGPFCPLPEEPR